MSKINQQKNYQTGFFLLVYEILSFLVMVFIFLTSFYAIITHLDSSRWQIPLGEKILSFFPF